MVGWSQQTRGAWYGWRERFREASRGPALPVLEMAKFKPRFPEIPKRECYREPAGEDFWERFPVNTAKKATPGMSGVVLRELVKEFGSSDIARVNRVLGYIEKGADIGCRGMYRCPTVSGNATSAYESGQEVSDAIASWIVDGYAAGPVAEEDVPAGAKINGIMVRKKPNGSARIILNLSAPKGMSVNDGISAEEFPAVMSSTAAWVTVLNKAGVGAWMTKTDWASAYKQVTVREEDIPLQWFEWGGKFFVELCLIFGSASSAGIFDDAAKVVLDLVCRRAKFSIEMICQHLDDICAASSDRGRLVDFDSCFRVVAERLGVKLAPRDDHDKTFAPCQKGVVFGVEYDTVSWTWSLPEKKKWRIVATIREAVASTSLGAKEVQSLAGKLINIRPLIPAGCFNIDHVMGALAESSSADRVTLSPECKRQLGFWEVAVLACNGWLAIPDPVGELPPWAKNVYTDAAGGTLDSVGRGTGGVLEDRWFYVPWSAGVNGGYVRVEGKKVGRKLSALELIGPLVALVVFGEDCRRWPVNIWVDNAGSVGVWKKGYSNFCRLCTTLVKAISVVAAGLGCRVDIKKITRCSERGAVMADMLSKARFNECFELGRKHSAGWQREPARVPAVLLQWVAAPHPDDDLGHRLLADLANRGVPVLGYGPSR